ncbi:MAG: hypothetical protein ACOCWM_00760 [Cyclobacteriaceae bacterium]
MINNKVDAILILGRIPPPIGGVTIHVKRLLDAFSGTNITKFCSLSEISSFHFLKQFLQYRFIHLHTSNPAFRSFLCFFSMLLNKKLIITFHGNIGRYGAFKNILDKLSIWLCSKPILLNKESCRKALKLNSRSELLSAFIPPLKTHALPENHFKEIQALKSKGINIYCTNAFNVTFDKEGKEIYGITQLLKLFSRIPESRLVISDPSGQYKNYILKNYPDFKSTPLWISEPHDFFEVLKLSDGFIRNTTTDGDSLSIKESLFLNVPVYATDVVDRPHGCFLYKKPDNLFDHFSTKKISVNPVGKINIESPVKRLEEIYTSYL